MEAAGIVAVPGLGLSPGLTNVIVRHASEEIELRSVEILFAIFREIAPSRGALDTIVWEAGEFSPDRNYYEDGRLVPGGPGGRRPHRSISAATSACSTCTCGRTRSRSRSRGTSPPSATAPSAAPGSRS